MKTLLERYLPLREGEGAGTGGEGDKGGKPADPAPGAAAAYHPAGLPENFRGSDDRATIDALVNAYKPLREKLNTIPKAPEKADAYKLVMNEKATEFMGDLSEDPLMKSIPELALQHKLTADQYGFVGEVMNKMVELGAYAKQPSDADLAGQLADPKLEGQQKEDALKAGMERITNGRTWVDGLGEGYSDNEKAELTLMTTSPGGLQLIEKLMAGSVGNTVNPGGSSVHTGGSIQDVITSRITDPRNVPNNAKYDRNFAQETRRMQQQHSG